jgi:hypothetical protein
LRPVSDQTNQFIDKIDENSNNLNVTGAVSTTENFRFSQKPIARDLFGKD